MGSENKKGIFLKSGPRIIFGLILTGALAAWGCSARPLGGADGSRIMNYTACLLNPAQGQGSFFGKWNSLPVSLVMDRDFYLSDEGAGAPAVRSAVETWNGWSRLRGLQAFRLSLDSSGVSGGLEIPEITDCTQAAYSAAITDMVGIWKISTHGNRRNARPSCGTQENGQPRKILPDGVQGQTDWVVLNNRIVGASVLLNFDFFNSPGTQRVDVESLVLHELGHVLGLLHSCNGSGNGAIDGTSSPPCGQGNPRFNNAVMFPFLEVNQERRALLQNDYDRVNCLY
jgi:hypothetical protein